MDDTPEETGVLMGLKGLIPTSHVPKMGSGISVAIRTTTLELVQDKSGTTG